MFRACELKDQTYEKTRTLHFSEICGALILARDTSAPINVQCPDDSFHSSLANPTAMQDCSHNISGDGAGA